MKTKIVYAALLLMAVCGGARVVAQTTDADMAKYYTFERMRSKSGWLTSDNPAGLIENQVSHSTAEAAYDFSKGGLRNVTDGHESHTVGISSESYRRWERLSFYGKLNYSYSSALDRSWAGNTDLYTSPMSVGDSMPGNTRNEVYGVKAGVAYAIGNWSIGVQAEYENQSLAKRRDSRNLNNYMNMTIRPGVMYRSKWIDAGLNLSYKRVTENIDYTRFGTNEKAGTIYLFEGLWFYTTEQISTSISTVNYKDAQYGGAVQAEFKCCDRLKFFNQFSADYGSKERFYLYQDQKLGDDDELVYRYLGIVNCTTDKVDHRLTVDASFGDVLKYNNIQGLITETGSTVQNYKQYGKFLKFQQTQRRVDVDYKIFVKRNEWVDKWIFDLKYSYFKNKSEYTIHPASYKQDLHYSRLEAGVTRNFLFDKRNWLDFSLRGGYHFGGGTQLDKRAPETLVIENENYRADLLAQEYNYLTNNRIIFAGGLRYTHYMPAKKIGLFADLTGRGNWCRNGLFDGSRRGDLRLTIGLNF